MNNPDEIIGIGLESSCDETAVSIVKNGREILSNCVFSQIDLHREYAGVVPEIASRAHLEVINGLIDVALRESGTEFKALAYVAATTRPGLVGSLLIALQTAKALSFTMNIPLVSINHLEAHLYAPFLENRELFFPYIGLLVSGGNTALFHVKGIGQLELIGKTVDDAAGEAFDKISKYLNLGYPGGPIIEKMASQARGDKKIFPKILSNSKEDFRFSYSGLKTAVITHMRDNPDADIYDIAHSFQERALELLVRRAFSAARKLNIKNIVVAGGVASNGRLREMLRESCENGETIIIPSAALCTDNAAMVAGLGYHYFINRLHSPLSIDVCARV